MSNQVEASDTKPKNYSKRYRLNDEPSQEDENSLNLEEHRRKPPLFVDSKDSNKSGEESLTYNQVEYFTSQRKQQIPEIVASIDAHQQITPQKANPKNLRSKSKTRKSSASKSPQHKLTKETLDVIKKAKESKVAQASNSDKVSKILSKPSLRDRFQNLKAFNTTRDLLLHTRYRDLVKSFEQIDQMVSFMRQRKQTPFWNQIQSNLYEASKINMNLSVVQRILSVWPESYVLSWMINEKLIRMDKYDIVVQLSQTIVFDLRVEQFKTYLLSYVQSHGEHIEESDLPTRPDKQQAETIQQYIEKSESLNPLIEPKSKRAHDILKRIADSNRLQQTHSIDLARYKTIPSNIESSTFSLALLQKIRDKEQKLKIAHVDVVGESLSKDKLILIASILYNYYLSRQVSNMFIANVVSYLKNNNKRFILSDAQILENITQLSSILPNWIKIIENTQGSILRMDKSIGLPLLLKEIDNYTQLKQD